MTKEILAAAQGGVLFWLRFLLPGLAWHWVLPRPADAARAPWLRFVLSAWAVAWLGLAINLTVTLILAESGWFVPAVDWSVLLLLSVLGLFLRGRFRGKEPGARSFYSPFASAALALFFAGILLLPGRGEWLLGGWDPGIYMNEGLFVARTGTFHPPPVPVHQELSREELSALMRHSGPAHELFPGVPVDLGTRRYDFYFFRLMPCAVASFYRCGGLAAALRVNHVLALFAWLAAGAAAWALSRSGPVTAMMLLLLVAQPVWLYHTHVPISELLQGCFFFTMWAGMLAWEPGRRRTFLLAWMAFLGIVNRFSFLPWVGLWLGVLAVLEMGREDRRRVFAEHAVLVAAAVGGALFNRVFCAITLGRIAHAWHTVKLISAALFAGVLAVDAASSVGPLRPRLLRLRVPLLAGALAAGVLGFAALAVASARGLHPVFFDFLEPLVRLVRWPVLALGILGLVSALWPGRSRREAILLFALFGVGTLAYIAWSPGAVGIFPYAARRFLEFTIPAIVFFAALLLGSLWAFRGYCGRALAVLLLAGALLSCARTAARAWRATAYDGVAARIEEVAAHLGASDIVVADHFWWSTPLALIHGKQALNGERIWARRLEKEPAEVKTGLAAIHRLKQRGYRVLLLTSTPDALGLYPAGAFSVKELWSGPSFELWEVIHGPHVTDFGTRPRKFVFRLFELL